MGLRTPFPALKADVEDRRIRHKHRDVMVLLRGDETKLL